LLSYDNKFGVLGNLTVVISTQPVDSWKNLHCCHMTTDLINFTIGPGRGADHSDVYLCTGFSAPRKDVVRPGDKTALNWIILGRTYPPRASDIFCHFNQIFLNFFGRFFRQMYKYT